MDALVVEAAGEVKVPSLVGEHEQRGARGHVEAPASLREAGPEGSCRRACFSAVELSMPFFEVRRRWLAVSLEKPVEGDHSTDAKVQRLADEFHVTPMAMRVRVEQMKLARK